MYAVAFFKVLQQHNIVKWETQLYVCGQIMFVYNSEAIIKIGQYLRKLCSNEKGSSFFDSQRSITFER